MEYVQAKIRQSNICSKLVRRQKNTNTHPKVIPRLWVGVTQTKRELSFASFDSLRFWTTLSIQIYAQKTHTVTVSVHKPALE